MKTRTIGFVILLVLALALGVVSTVMAQGPWGNTGRSPGGWMGGMMGAGVNGYGMMGGRQGVTGDASQPFDLRFLNQMIEHHEMGVLMTQHMVINSTRPEMRDLAQRIITAQQREIEQMRQWRTEWYGVTHDDTWTMPMIGSSMMSNMMRSGMMDGSMMGRRMDSDRMFLLMMIPHHEDAISIAQQALTQAEHPEIKTLAQTITTTQRAENDEMRGYLRTWYGIL